MNSANEDNMDTWDMVELSEPVDLSEKKFDYARVNQVIDTLEDNKMKYCSQRKLERRLGSLNIILCILIVCSVFFSQKLVVLMVIAFVIGSFSYLKVLNRKKEILYTSEMVYKNEFTRAALENVLDEFEYECHRGFEEGDVYDFCLVSLVDIFKSKDYIKAKYKGVKFELADVSIINIQNDKLEETPFKGIMIKFDISLKNVTELQVFTDNFKYRADTERVMKTVEMEDVDFNKKFDVYSAKEEDAFYVLTPAFMEKLKELGNRHKSLALNFRDDMLCVGINTYEDMFDFNLEKEIDFIEELKRVRQNIQDIFDIIDILEIDKGKMR